MASHQNYQENLNYLEINKILLGTPAPTSTQIVQCVTCQGFSGTEENMMFGMTPTPVDFPSLDINIPFLITQPKVNLSHSIIGNNFFMKFDCRSKRREALGYSDITFNEIHKTLLKVRNTQEVSNHVSQTTDPEINIENEKQSTTNTDSIPLKDQFTSLVSKIFGGTKKAKEKI